VITTYLTTQGLFRIIFFSSDDTAHAFAQHYSLNARHPAILVEKAESWSPLSALILFAVHHSAMSMPLPMKYHVVGHS
jgi:hypothetical protein